MKISIRYPTPGRYWRRCLPPGERAAAFDAAIAQSLEMGDTVIRDALRQRTVQGMAQHRPTERAISSRSPGNGTY